jgi:spore coat protein H
VKNVFAEEMPLYRWLEWLAIGAFLLAGLVLCVRAWTPPAAPGPELSDGAVWALASAMPNQGWAPLEVHLSAMGSQSRNGSIVRYEWDLDGNGHYDVDATPTGGYLSYRFVKPGRYTVYLRVTDEHGASASDQVTIEVRHPASSSVDYWLVFDDRRVRRVDILLTSAAWDLMWIEPQTKATVPADAIIFGERLNNVGFRMRGQDSLRRSGSKKPWEIDTDAFVEGQEYHNLRQLAFSNGINDPTLLTEKLSYDMMALAGVPASHATFVELWIDITDDDRPAAFWGVYTMVEQVDKKFIANRFGQDAKLGNLYKASYARGGPMDLIYHGDRIEDYPTRHGRYAYIKTGGEGAADYQDIIELCRVVDGTEYDTPEEFAQALERVLNVDGFLRYLAVVTTTMDWDTYPNTGNNYYLFHNPSTGRFEWIPWDLCWGDNPEYPLYHWPGMGRLERAPLTDRIFQVERYRQRYRSYLDLLNRHYFNEEKIREKAWRYHQMIAPYVRQGTGDPMYTGPEAMFSMEQFDGGWRRLAELAAARSRFIRQDLEQGL